MNSTILILANSAKHHAHCVAGKCIETGNWIRPVADVTGKELSHGQIEYTNPYGTFSVSPLQKIAMTFLADAPLPHQPENKIITDQTWTQNFSIAKNQLQAYLDHPESLWGPGDRIEYSHIDSGAIAIPQSLYLVGVEGLELYTNERDKRRVRFRYRTYDYDLACTDPKFAQHAAAPDELQNILCISLGEPYTSPSGSRCCYKLAATIF